MRQSSNAKPVIDRLEKLYLKYNRREFIHPDPLEFLADYPDVADREIVALVASSLAYGRVAQILIAVNDVLSRIERKPLDFVKGFSGVSKEKAFSGFKHRFASTGHMISLFRGMRRAINKYGSLEKCFNEGHEQDNSVLPRLKRFAERLSLNNECGHLIPDPSKGSACKRLNLFLRWMVRQDDVDPGGWTSVSRSALMIPLDTHMHKVGRMLGFTDRAQADMKTAVEVTKGFRKMCPEDPVKYDFALTRLGIRKDSHFSELTEL